MDDPWRVKFGARAYRHVMKPIFFRFDPEVVHDHMTRVGQILGRWAVLRALTRFAFDAPINPALVSHIAGIQFPNPIGLAAGFDKNAHLWNILPDVGFGFAELGSITGQPCAGNPRPRLWRLPDDEALVVYYGLKNDGADAIAARLAHMHARIPIGISAARTNSPHTTEVAAGIVDYCAVVDRFRGIGDYLTINVSCPNTCGGEPFTDPQLLDQLLREVDIRAEKPVFLKLAADLTPVQLDAIIEVADQHNVAGFVSSNLTKNRSQLSLRSAVVPDHGGISGRAVQQLSDQQIQYLYRHTKGKYHIIGVGGIFSAEDAYRKIRLGASLLQLITGMVYRGPQLIGQLNRGLLRLLKRDGYASIPEAVGVDNRVG